MDDKEKAIVLKCYNVCMDYAQTKFDLYKGIGTNKEFKGSIHVDGMSHGADECGDAILDAFGVTVKDLTG